MTSKTLTTIIDFNQTCGCIVEIRQTFNFDENNNAVGDPTARSVLSWKNRCLAHAGMRDLDAYDKINSECRLVSTIEQSFIDVASPEQIVEESLDNGSKIYHLVEPIQIIFGGETIIVNVPESLQDLEGVVTEQDGVVYEWQR